MIHTELFSTKTPILDQGDSTAKRDEILRYFHQTFDVDEQLYTAFADEKAMFRKADPLRHPLIFYYGHTATFFINKLNISKIISRRINPRFESMFAIGVDEMSWDDLNENHYDWPSFAEVTEYRQQVRQLIDELIRTLPLKLPIGWDDPFWIILMGIEHERIHLETSSVLIRQVPLASLQPIESWNPCPYAGAHPQNSFVEVPGESFTLGKSFDSPTYGWDNEYGQKHVTLKSFQASKYLCSNGEYKEFVDAGGYHVKEYWTDEGWNWKSYMNAEFPRFWRKIGDVWKLRLVYHEIDMPWNWPVEINYLEAKAFCNWKSEKIQKQVRLLTEEEWYALRMSVDIPDQPEWDQAPGNINMEHFQSPCPVDYFSFGDFYDVIGNVWQWTETPISGFDGFKIHPAYDDFSTPTFDTKHNLIKGGSWISTGNESIKESRYAFRRHFYQHAGFRYVISPNEVEIPDEVCETDFDVTKYCESQYGQVSISEINYFERIAQIAIQYSGQNKNSALDLGCRTGRTTFEMANFFDQVTGLDFTARMIRVASHLQENGSLTYEFPEEGELVAYRKISLQQLGLEKGAGKVKFLQSDASNMKTLFVGYDLVLINDILDQMYDPRHFLQGVHKRMNPGGRLIVASSFDWDERCTRKETWVGGHRESGEQIWGLDDLEHLLKDTFRKIAGPIVIPQIIRMNRRKFTWKNIDVTVWELL